MTKVFSEIIFKNENELGNENQCLGWQSDDYIHSEKKCGEIIMQADTKFWFVCTFCDERFHSIVIFRSHIEGIHISDVENISINKIADPLESTSTGEKILIKSEPGLNNVEFDKETNISPVKIICDGTEDIIKLEGISNEFSEYKILKEDNIKTYQEDSDTERSLNCKHSENTKSAPTKIIKRRNRKKIIHSCTLCQHIARDKNALEIHLHSKHGIGSRRHQCEECGKCFSNSHHLKSHLVIHSGTRPFKCDYCKSDFAHYNSLKYHRYLHTGERPHKCSECDKGFVSSSALKNHFREHTGETSYNCQICQKTLATKCSFKRHMISHSGRRAHECQQCKKAFLHKEDLNKHMMCHSEEKNFACDICLKRFIHKKNLVQHQKLHLDTKEYICKICSKAFAQHAGLYSHMKYHKDTSIEDKI